MGLKLKLRKVLWLLILKESRLVIVKLGNILEQKVLPEARSCFHFVKGVKLFRWLNKWLNIYIEVSKNRAPICMVYKLIEL